MAFPDEVLVEGERVVAHLHPHWRVLVGPVLAFLLTVGAGGYLAAVARGHGWAAWGLPGLAGLAAVLVLWLTVAPVVRWRTTHLVVTDRRLLVREGVLSRQDVDVPLGHITGVRTQRSLLGQMLDYGTLVIDTEGGEAVEFADVPGAERLPALLYPDAMS